MGAPVQLKLWPDEAGQVEVQCVHCGWRFDALPQIRQQQTDMEQRVLAHPQVRALRTRTRTQAFFEQLLPTLLCVEGPVGVKQIADETDYSVGGAHYQIQRLVKSGVLRAVHKVQNGRSGTYHQYELAISSQILAN
jgi:predicted HTH transcriptional regulator